ncbi:hypothetical protein HETIRDRAFT_317250 [Heterobasidion irregulare TC 32-1]|uniref:Uncharacterized protein n=1 Tax=Heterobasidion irregulare (strain TC 32-1) TaxID=747525 RepID=W4K8C9_HETIT|nr:uncharacterized protein HETIRDRAFT_317250 [Heterobasidion irregulare TC 32-1]ETW81301.1 hypothetical protein HETIRDRAFT_317250 [Heterobasidion irregulare TC 32-1]
MSSGTSSSLMPLLHPLCQMCTHVSCSFSNCWRRLFPTPLQLTISSSPFAPIPALLHHCHPSTHPYSCRMCTLCPHTEGMYLLFVSFPPALPRPVSS